MINNAGETINGEAQNKQRSDKQRMLNSAAIN